MNQIYRPGPPPKRTDEEPFYGWRYTKRTRPDGTEKYEEVELRKEDLLYPEEGDHVVYEWIHTRDFTYCTSSGSVHVTVRPLLSGSPANFRTTLPLLSIM